MGNTKTDFLVFVMMVSLRESIGGAKPRFIGARQSGGAAVKDDTCDSFCQQREDATSLRHFDVDGIS